MGVTRGMTMMKKLLRVINVSAGETLGFVVVPLRVEAMDVFAKIPHDIDILVESEGWVAVAESCDEAAKDIMWRWGTETEAGRARQAETDRLEEEERAKTCGDEHHFDTDDRVRCSLPTGHGGNHKNGPFSWTD